ncbi:MAG: hypothetical protein WBD02_10750 [Acidimicrobiia bacterium]
MRSDGLVKNLKIASFLLLGVGLTGCPVPGDPVFPPGSITLTGEAGAPVSGGKTTTLAGPATRVIAGEATFGSPHAMGGSSTKLWATAGETAPDPIAYEKYHPTAGTKLAVTLSRNGEARPFAPGTYTIDQMTLPPTGVTLLVERDFRATDIAVNPVVASAYCFAATGTVTIDAITANLADTHDPVWYVTAGSVPTLKMSFDVECLEVDMTVTPPVLKLPFKHLTGSVDIHP